MDNLQICVLLTTTVTGASKVFIINKSRLGDGITSFVFKFFFYKFNDVNFHTNSSTQVCLICTLFCGRLRSYG